MASRRSQSASAVDADFDRFAEVVHRLASHYRFALGEPDSALLARWLVARVSFLAGERVTPATMAKLWRIVPHWPPDLVARVAGWPARSARWAESMWGPELDPEAPGQPARAYLVSVDEWPWPPPP